MRVTQRRWRYDTKIDVKKMVYEHMNWSETVYDKVQHQNFELVVMVMKSGVLGNSHCPIQRKIIAE